MGAKRDYIISLYRMRPTLLDSWSTWEISTLWICVSIHYCLIKKLQINEGSPHLMITHSVTIQAYDDTERIVLMNYSRSCGCCSDLAVTWSQSATSLPAIKKQSQWGSWQETTNDNHTMSLLNNLWWFAYDIMTTGSDTTAISNQHSHVILCFKITPLTDYNSSPKE